MAVVRCYGRWMILLGMALWASAAIAELTVGNSALISSKRVSRTHFEYVYTADLTNSSGAVENATAAVASSAGSTIIIDSSLNFGNVAANSSVTSTDTFSFQQDRRVAFDPSVLTFTVSATPVVTDNTPPVFSINSPANNSLVSIARPVISISYSDASGVNTGSIAFTQNGSPLPVSCQLNQTGGNCTPVADIVDGSVVLAASIQDTLGNTATAQVTILVDNSPVSLSVTSPADGFITTASSIAVSGTAGPGVTTVKVNDVNAPITNGSFSATVPLREGKNMLVAVGTKDSGKTGTSSVDITRDIVAPIVKIDSPRDGFNSVEDRIAVTGLVNDIVSGGINPRVFVNGLEATVSDGTFMLVDLPVVRGPNVIQVVATDAVGNQASDSITVNFQTITGKRITVISGNGQADLTNELLPQPIVVAVKDNLGNPVAGSVVNFEVTRNSGLIRANTGDTGKRSLQIPTNGSGQASVLFQLGDTTGEGNNRITATSLGVAGEAEFCASALSAGATEIKMVMGDNQRGIVGQPLAQPLEAMVVDKDGNPIKNLPVTFSITRGDGNLDGLPEISKITGSDGVARAVLTLGPQPGINNNVVKATFVGATTVSAIFMATGVAAGNPANTQFTGVVLDNAHTPIPGSVVSIIDTSVSAVTDDEGQFLLSNVPVGKIHLRIDPTASPRPETFPPLEFETVTIAGQVNILGQPILLPAVQTQNSKLVGGDEDVTIFMPGVAGMSVTVVAGSATFPNGDKTGQLSISQVHLDKVPMPPPNGSLFMPPAWTIQPAGVKFDPPAKVTIPNDGLPPGRIIDIFQFDHTLNQFINVGKAVVADDGFDIISDNGFGITRTGWGGCGLPPPPDTCTRSCGPAPTPADECQEVESPECPGCPFLKAADPSKSRSEQTPNDCSRNTCGGPELDESDPPEDQPNDCINEVCVGPPEPDDGETPPDDCQVCLGGSPQPDPSNDGNTCIDGCGTCVNGSCEITDPNRPKENQTPNDCKTEVCEGPPIANPGDAPTDVCKICDGTNVVDDPNKENPTQTPNDCKTLFCDGRTAANPGDAPIDECKTCSGEDIVDKTNTPKPAQIPNNCQIEMCAGEFNPNPNDKPVDVANDCKSSTCFIDLAGGSARLITDLNPNDHNTPDAPNDCAKPICTAIGSSATTLIFDSNDNTDKCSVCAGINSKTPKTTDQVSPNICQEFQCDSATGLFSLQNKAADTPTGNQCLLCDGAGGTKNKLGSCDDGRSCTTGDTCSAGVCSGTLDTSIPGCSEEDNDLEDVTVRLTMFIPVDHVTMPKHPLRFPVWDDIVFTGDNRDFAGNNFTYYDQENQPEPLPQSGGIAYRIAQEFVVRPGSGIINEKNLSGTTMRFDIPTSMTDGSLELPVTCYRKSCSECTDYAPGRPMTVPDQCLSLSSRQDTIFDGVQKEAQSPASTSSMSVTLVSQTADRVLVRLKGSPANSLVPLTPTALTFQIDWDFFMEFNISDGKAVSWRVFGTGSGFAAHDPFPAYELEVNKNVIYRRDPIPNGNNPDDLGVFESGQIELNITGSGGL